MKWFLSLLANLFRGFEDDRQESLDVSAPPSPKPRPSTCFSEFNLRGTRTERFMMNTGAERHTCPVCNARYTTINGLPRHVCTELP